MDIAIAGDSVTYDLAAGIDNRSEDRNHWGVRGYECREIAHDTILADKSPQVSVRVHRSSNHLASIVNPEPRAVDISRKRAEILHTGFFGPQESVRARAARQGRDANHLTLIVDVQTNIPDPWQIGVHGTAEVAEINWQAIIPEHCVRTCRERRQHHVCAGS